MYRFLFTLLVSIGLISTTAQAQDYPIDQGSIVVGGSAHLTSQSGADDRVTQWGLNPMAHYFVIPGLAVGASAGFGQTRFDGESITSYQLGPAVSYYLGGPEQTVIPFAGASTSISHSTSTLTDLSSTSYWGDIEAGFVLMIARNVGLTGAAFLSGDLEDFGDNNRFGLRFGVRTFVF